MEKTTHNQLVYRNVEMWCDTPSPSIDEAVSLYLNWLDGKAKASIWGHKQAASAYIELDGERWEIMVFIGEPNFIKLKELYGKNQVLWYNDSLNRLILTHIK